MDVSYGFIKYEVQELNRFLARDDLLKFYSLAPMMDSDLRESNVKLNDQNILVLVGGRNSIIREYRNSGPKNLNSDMYGILIGVLRSKVSVFAKGLNVFKPERYQTNTNDLTVCFISNLGSRFSDSRIKYNYFCPLSGQESFNRENVTQYLTKTLYDD